jgi:hypothetical protein
MGQLVCRYGLARARDAEQFSAIRASLTLDPEQAATLMHDFRRRKKTGGAGSPTAAADVVGLCRLNQVDP